MFEKRPFLNTTGGVKNRVILCRILYQCPGQAGYHNFREAGRSGVGFAFTPTRPTSRTALDSRALLRTTLRPSAYSRRVVSPWLPGARVPLRLGSRVAPLVLRTPTGPQLAFELGNPLALLAGQLAVLLGQLLVGNDGQRKRFAKRDDLRPFEKERHAIGENHGAPSLFALLSVPRLRTRHAYGCRMWPDYMRCINLSGGGVAPAWRAPAAARLRTSRRHGRRPREGLARNVHRATG